MVVQSDEVHRFYAVASSAPAIRILRGSEEFASGVMSEQTPGLFYYDATLPEGSYVVIVELAGKVMDARVVEARPITADESLDLVRKVLTNTKKVVGTNLVIFDDDGVTPLISWSLLDESGNPVDRNPMQAIKQ